MDEAVAQEKLAQEKRDQEISDVSDEIFEHRVRNPDGHLDYYRAEILWELREIRHLLVGMIRVTRGILDVAEDVDPGSEFTDDELGI